MKALKRKTPGPDYNAIIAEELENAPLLDDQLLADLAAANRQLEADPAHRADVLKGIFVDQMLRAMESRGISKADLAALLHRSRQYVQKLFDENKRVNFTVETLCSVAHALGQRVYLHTCPEGHEPMITTCIRDAVISDEDSWEFGKSSSTELYKGFVPDPTDSKVSKSTNLYVSANPA